MALAQRRIGSAGLLVVVTALAGVATNVVTDSGGWAWGVALGVAVASAAGLQMWLTSGERDANEPSEVSEVSEPASGPVVASGPAAVSVGGSLTRGARIVTNGTGPAAPPESTAHDGTTARGPGAVAIGRDASGEIQATGKIIDEGS
ncbi:hypothetical protein [Micromonospora sp. AKA38]|uniref:hypothetical protein n=1 Tax=Micromonospora sp. AKA38 TaxID=2733861 RepID=UPI0022CA0547|nr:hypothetical protein [Micromonospora sp. AKA38]GHJ12963.1 hypothetical protein TPA0908_09580 [Micromonospora sp. AKA38]